MQRPGTQAKPLREFALAGDGSGARGGISAEFEVGAEAGARAEARIGAEVDPRAEARTTAGGLAPTPTPPGPEQPTSALAGAGITHVGAALRHGRHTRRLSQRELADAAGVSQSLVARLERGELGPAIEALRSVLDAVGFEVLLVHAGGCVGESAGTDSPGVAGSANTCRDWVTDGRVRHRDAAGRAFPAHGEATWEQHPPLYWLFRHGWPWPTPQALLWHYRDGAPNVRRPACAGDRGGQDRVARDRGSHPDKAHERHLGDSQQTPRFAPETSDHELRDPGLER